MITEFAFENRLSLSIRRVLGDFKTQISNQFEVFKKSWKWHGQKYLVQVYSLLFFFFIIRAYELWTEEFLISEYGDLTVRLEARAEANDRLPVGEADILGRDTIKHFIQNYQTMDAYVISQIPRPMERDIGIPPCLRLNL